MIQTYPCIERAALVFSPIKTFSNNNY